jgi:protein associated with RNAse G/E
MMGWWLAEGFYFVLDEEIAGSALSVTVRACKFDGREHRKWEATVLRHVDTLLVLDGRFETEVKHKLLGTIARGTVSIEYYWLDRWYNVFRFMEPDGGLRNYYCNVNIPPTYAGRVLSFVDLDMDILVAPDLSYQILDEDEFVVNAERYGYPAEVRGRAHEALAELREMIEGRQFPFNYQV